MSVKPIIFANNVKPEKIVEALKSLQSPDRLPISSIENAVLSVNGQIGHIQVGQTQTIAQINSDWNATSGAAKILNKPEIPVINYPVVSVNGKSGNVEISMQDIEGLSEEMNKKMDTGESFSISQIEDMPTIPEPQIKSDWNSTSGMSEILNKPHMFSGLFVDLEGTPEFSDVAMTGSYSDLENTPELFDGDYNSLSNKPNIFSGGYEDLTGKPTLSIVATSGSYSDLKDKPILFDGKYSSLSGKPNLFSGSYTDLTNKPNLFSGSYNDLSERPTIPASQIQSDWNQNLNTSLDFIKNKPPLFSGSYSDLTNKPSIPAAQIQSDWGQTNSSAIDYIKNKPTLFSGSYNDLSNKPSIPVVDYPVKSVNAKTGTVVLTPGDLGAAAATHNHSITEITGLQAALDSKLATGATIPYSSITGTPVIPAAQIQANWSQTTTTALDYIKNKPNLFSGSYTDLTNKPTIFDGTWSSLTGKPVLSTVATSGSYVDLTNKPTIPVIPTNLSSFTNDSGYLTTVPVTSVNNKTGAVVLSASDVGASPSGQGTKYYRQTGTQATGVKVKYYQVTSDANGAWTLNLGTDFTEIFDVQAQAVSTTGIAGVRQSTVNAFTSTSTVITGMTWGNTLILTILLSGTNSLSLTPNTIVRLRVEGIGA